METLKYYGGKAILNKNMLSLFYERWLYSLRRFNYNRELIPNCWCSYRENTFANIQHSFWNKQKGEIKHIQLEVHHYEAWACTCAFQCFLSLKLVILIADVGREEN